MKKSNRQSMNHAYGKFFSLLSMGLILILGELHAQRTPTDDGDFVFSATEAHRVVSARLSDETFIVAYKDGVGTASDILTVVGTYSGGTISGYGSIATVETSATATDNRLAIVGLSATKAVILYSENGTTTLKYRVLDINISTSAVMVNSAGNLGDGEDLSFLQSLNATALSSTQLVAVYERAAPDFVAVAGTVSGSTITWGTTVVVDAGNVSYTDIVRMDATKFAIAYEDDDAVPDAGNIVAGTVSGNTITMGTPQVFEGTDQADVVAIAALSDTEVVVAYENVTNSDAEIFYATLSGTVFSFPGTNSNFESSTSLQDIYMNALSSTEVFLTTHSVTGPQGDFYVGLLSGNNITIAATGTTYLTGGNADDARVVPLNSDVVVVSYNDEDNINGSGVDFGSTQLFELTTTTNPEINVQGNATSIVSGDDTPSAGDHTDFGTGAALSRTFTIQNQGTGTLTLGASAVTITGTNAADYSVNTQPATTVAGSGSTTFIIDFASGVASTRSAEIHINSDDLHEYDYTFSIQAVGVACVAPTAQATSPMLGTATFSTQPVNSWTAPAGGATGYVVIMNTSASFTTPTDGTSPTANTSYISGEQVIYNGTSASPNITVTNLSPSTTYHYRIYSYNDCSGTETYESTGLDVSNATIASPTASCTDSNATGAGTAAGVGTFGQSFTTTCGGLLSSITIEIDDINTGGDDVVSGAIVSVLSGNGTVGGLVGSALTNVTINEHGTVVFDFTNAGVMLAATTQYTFMVEDNGDASQFGFDVSSSNPYAGGHLWINAASGSGLVGASPFTGDDLVFSVDIISPPTFTTTWLDENPADGTIDRVRLDFSENVTFADVGGAGDIFDAISISGGITLTSTTENEIDFATLIGVSNYTFDITGATGTADPGVDVTYNAANNSITGDVSGLIMTNASTETSSIDGAAPVLISTGTQDSNNNGQIDRILVTYSELIDAGSVDEVATVDPGDDFTDDFIVTGYEIASAAPLAGSGVDDDEIVIVLTESGASDTDAVPNVTITVSELSDLAVASNTNAASSAAATDTAAPTVVTSVTLDNNSNGQIDRITITLSEDIDATTLDEVATVDPGDDFTDDFVVTGYDIASVLPQAGTGVDDNVLIITLTESGGSDTGVTPTVTLGVGELADLAAAPISNIAYSAASTDEAVPILIAASSTPLDNATGVALSSNVVLTFSENIQAGSGNISIIDVASTDDRVITLPDPQLIFSTNTLTINPSTDLLTENNNYAVNVAGTAITDLASPVNAYAGIGDNTTMDFTTNNSPVTTFPGTQSTDGTTNVTFSGTISIADAESDNQSVTISVLNNGDFTTSTGTLTATQSGSAVVGGSGTATLTISGTLVDVNGTLNGMAYVPGSIAGQHEITINTDDGNGGTDSDVVLVNVSGTYTLTVSTDNAGAPEAGSLRAAIGDANLASGSADVIDASGLGASQTITLAGDLPANTDDLTINGPGASNLNIDGVDTHRIFENVIDDNLTITALSISNGLNATNGGAIFHSSSGILTVTGVHFNSSSAASGDGGAIFNTTGSANISQCLFTGNSAGNSAGAIYSSSTLNVDNSTFNGNSSTTSGGAIRVALGTTNLDHVTISNNSAGTTGDGIVSTNGTTTLNYSIVSGNGTNDVDVFGGTFDAESTANIIGTSTGTITSNTNVTDGSTDFTLTAIADNGGETQTMFISGTEALAAATGSSETVDQIGNTRSGSLNDLGALEVAPEILNAYFFDVDPVDGVIDEVVIELSEEVDESTALNTDFAISSGTLGTFIAAGPANNSLDVSNSDEFVTFPITSYGLGTGIATLTMSYTSGTLTNAAAEAVNSNGSITLNDNAFPVFVSGLVADANRDDVVVTFSENMTSTDESGFDIQVGGSGTTVNTFNVTNAVMTFTLSADVIGGQAVTIEYTAASGDAADLNANALANFGPSGITNNVNNIPTFAGLDNAANFIEDGTAVVLDNNATVADAELDVLDDWDGATITVVRNTTLSTNDVFGFDNDATYIFTGGNIEKSSSVIASYDITTTPGQLVITFDNTIATPLANDADAILQRITYSNPNDNPPVNVLLDFTINDGSDDSAVGNITVTITPNDDSPSLVGLDATAASAFTEDGSAIVLDGNATVVDPELDNADDWNGATITVVRNTLLSTNDVFDFNDDAIYIFTGGNIEKSGQVIASYDITTTPGQLVVTFSNAVTTPLANDADAVLQRITYSNSNQDPGTSVNIDFTVDDGNTDASGTIAVTINPVNDAPTSSNNTVTAEEDQTYTFANANFPFTDAAESHAFQEVYVMSLPVTGTLRYGGVLAATGTLNGYTDRTQFTYDPVADENGTTYTTFTFQVVDNGGTPNGGMDNSGTFTMTIDVTAINDEPTITGLTGADDQANVSDNTPVVVNGFLDIGAAGDIDYGPADEEPGGANAQTVNTSGFTLTITDPSSVLASASIDDSGNLTYTPNENVEGTATIEVQVQDDGGTSGTGADDTSPAAGAGAPSFDIVITDNDAPAITNPTSTDLTPADDASGIVVSTTTSLQILFDQDVTANVGNIDLFISTDLVTPVQTFDVTSGAVVITNNQVDITLTDFLEKDASYFVQIDANAFLDTSAGTLGYAGIANTSDWDWSMEATGSPNIISSFPLDNATDVPISTVLQFILDEPARYANSSEPGNVHTVTIDILTGAADGNFPATFSTLSGNDASTVNNNQDTGFTPFPSTINSESVGDVFFLDITSASTPISFQANTEYTVTVGQGAFEFAGGTADNPTFQFDFTTVPDATPPALVGDGAASFEPDDQPAFVRTVDASSLTQLDIIFDEDVREGSGNIQLFVDTNDDGVSDGVVFDIASNDAAISYIQDNGALASDKLRIDLSGTGLDIDLGGNLTYFINIDNGAIEDLFSNAYTGFSDATTWNFTTLDNDIAVPILVSETPADNSTSVSVATSQLIFEFDEPIQVVGGTFVTLRLLSNGEAVSAIDLDGSTPGSTVNVSGKIVTIGLPVSLSSLTQYYVTIDDGAITDFAGTPNEYGGITTPGGWNFLTEFVDDGNGPAATAFTPSHDPGNPIIGLNQSISVQFDEQVFEGTGNITITGGSSTITIPVAGTSIAGSMVTIPLSASTPIATDSLEYNTTYEVNLPLGAYQDINTNDSPAIVGSTTWSFSTIVDAFTPRLTNLTPIDDAPSEALQPTLILEFAEPIVNTGGAGTVDITYNDGTVLRTIALSDVGVDLTTPRFISIDFTSLASPLTLSGNTEYFVSIDNTSIEDDNGNAFGGIAADGTWSFTTIDDGTAPNVVPLSSIPAHTNTTLDPATLTDITIVFDEPVNIDAGGAGNLTVFYDDGGGTATDRQVFSIDLVNATSSNANGKTEYTYALPFELSGSSDYYITVAGTGATASDPFEDNDGTPNTNNEIFDNTSWTFSTTADMIDPTITVLSPADNAPSVDPTSAIPLTITFDERVTPQNIADGVKLIYTSDGTDVGISFNANAGVVNNSSGVGSVVTYSIGASLLSGGVEYEVVLDASAFQDLSSRTYAIASVPADGNWTFTTGDDGTPPAINFITSTPADGDGSVAVNTGLVLEFDEPVNSNTGNLTLHFAPLATDAVTAYSIDVTTSVVSNGGRTHTLAFPADLSGLTNYYINLPAGAFRDNDGAPNGNAVINDDVTWAFTTVAETVDPTFAFTPIDDATGVDPNNAALIFVFDERVTPQNSAGNIRIRYAADDVLAASLNASTSISGVVDNATNAPGSTITYTGALSGNTDYYVEVDANAFLDNSSRGNAAITGTTAWSFTTANEVPADVPSASFNPIDGGSGFDLRGDLVMTFNEPVFVNSGNITIADDAGVLPDVVIPVTDGVQVSGNGTTVITINPTDDLFGGTTYAVTMDVGVFQDASGNDYDLSNDDGGDGWKFDVIQGIIVDNGVGGAITGQGCDNLSYISQDVSGTNIAITETGFDDFRDAGTIILTLSSGFEFNPGVFSTASSFLNDIGIGGVVVTASTITITITNDLTGDGQDQIVLNGLEIRNTDGNLASTATITRTGGTADLYGNSVSHGIIHMDLSNRAALSGPTITAGLPSGTVDVTDGGGFLATGKTVSITATGAGAQKDWYYFNQAGSVFTGNVATETDLNGGTFPNNFDNVSDGLYTMYVTDTEADGCVSDFSSFSLAFGSSNLQSGTTNFLDDDATGKTLQANNPANHTLSFSGSGIGNTDFISDPITADFIPTTAGIGAHVITITITNDNTGASLSNTATYNVGAATAILLDIASTPPSVETDISTKEFCETDTPIQFIGATSDIDASNVLYEFVGSGISATTDGTTFNAGPGLVDNKDVIWEFDPVGLGTDGGTEYVIRRQVVDATSITPSADDFTQLNERLTVYNNPLVNVTNLDANYCADDSPVTIEVTVSINGLETTAANLSSVIVEKDNSGFSTIGTLNQIGVLGVELNFDDIINNTGQWAADGLTDSGAGTYRIRYRSDAIDDPNSVGPLCEGQLNTFTFNLFDLPAKPTLNLTGSIGYDQTANDYLFEYCNGGSIEDLSPNESTTIRWYNDDGFGGLGTEISTTPANVPAFDLFGTLTPASGSYLFHFTQTTNENSGAGFAGCESDFSDVTIEIYDIPTTPDFDVTGVDGEEVSTDYYVFEYCNGISISDLDIVVGANPITSGVDFYDWYAADGTTIIDGLGVGDADANGAGDSNGEGIVTSTGNVTATAVELLGSATPAAGTYTYFVGRRENRNLNASSAFDGCNSSLVQVDIVVHGIPSAPTVVNSFITDINACSGDLDINPRIATTDELVTPQETDVEYNWYASTGKTNLIGTVNDAGSPELTYNDIFTDVNVTTPAGTINDGLDYYQVSSDFNETIYISQITNKLNAQVTGFAGCESATETAVDITIYPLYAEPGFSAPDPLLTGPSGYVSALTADELNYYGDALTADSLFNLSTTYVENTTNFQNFEWWFASSAFAKQSQITVVDSSAANGEELILVKDRDATDEFVLSQVTDIEKVGGSGGTTIFDGCESAPRNLRVNTFNLPDAPEEDRNDAGGSVTDFYYCEGTTVADITVDGEDEDGAGAATGVPVTFYWYTSLADATNVDFSARTGLRLSTADASGKTILASELTPDETDDSGGAVTNMATSPGVGTYTFYVTQTTDINTGATPSFQGSESEPLEVTVNILEIPADPNLNDLAPTICEGDVIPQASITNTAGGVFTWVVDIDDNMTNDDTPDQNQVTSSTYTPADPGVGTQYYFVSQTTDINIGGSGFAGCESGYTTFILTQNAIPSAPTISGAGNFPGDPVQDNLHIYCSTQDAISTLSVSNAGDYTSPTFNWYSNFGLSTFIAAGDNFDNASTIDADFHPSFPFPLIETTDLQLEYYVTTVENGCESNRNGINIGKGQDEATFVDFRIVRLPAVDIWYGENVAAHTTGDVIDGTNICFDESVFSIQGVEDKDANFGTLDAVNTFIPNVIANFSINTAGLVDNSDGTSSFTASTAALTSTTREGLPTDHEITFTYTDSEGCTGTAIKTIEVKPEPTLGMFYQDGAGSNIAGTELDATEICYDEAQFIIQGTHISDFATVKSNASSGTFTIYTAFADANAAVPTNPLTTTGFIDLDGANDGRATFDPAQISTDNPAANTDREGASFTYYIRFDYSDANACDNFVVQSVIINPQPTLDIVYADDTSINATSLCYDNGVVILTGVQEGIDALTSAGTISFSINTGGLTDNGDGTATFNPVTAAVAAGTDREGLPTDHEITFTFTDLNGCENSITSTITVDPQPTLQIEYGTAAGGNSIGDGLNGTFVCYDEATFTLQGTHISDAATAESNATSGTFEIFTDAAGTAALVTTGLVDNTNGTATIDASQIATDGGETREGTASTYYIKFTYSDVNGCQNTVIESLTIEAQPTLDITFNAVTIGGAAICYDNGLIIMQGVQEGASATSGTFSINTGGLTDLGNGTASFDPIVAATAAGETREGLPSAHDITFNYTDGNSCSNSTTLTFTVNPQPTLDIVYADDTSVNSTSLCYDNGSVILTGIQEGIDALTSAGTISFVVNTGGLTDNGDGTASFDPAIAAVAAGTDREGLPTDHNITFTFTDLNGCENSITSTITVDPQPTLQIEYGTAAGGNNTGDGLNGTFICYDEATFTIQGTHISDAATAESNATSGTFEIFTDAAGTTALTTTGLVDNTNGSATIDASQIATDGGETREGATSTYYIKFTYSDANGCENSVIESITIEAQPTLDITFNGTTIGGAAICYDNGFIIMQGIQEGANATSGTFSVNTGGLTDLGNGTASFDPIVAATAAGETREGLPSTHDITFNYTDGNSCSNSITLTFTVNPQPTLDIVYADDTSINSTSLCYDNGSVTLTGIQEGIDALTSAGTISFVVNTGGLTDNGDGTASFDPAIAAVAAGTDREGLPTDHEITFTFTDLNGCENSITSTITVDPQPTLQIEYATAAGGNSVTDGLNGTFVCYDEATFTLQGTHISDAATTESNATSGTFEIFTDMAGTTALATSGLVDLGNGTATINPSQVATDRGETREGVASTYYIKFTYSDANGCQNTVIESITIEAQPTLDITFAGNTISGAAICYDNTLIIMQGVQEGANATSGTFSVNTGGLTDLGNGTASFDPAAAALAFGETREGLPSTHDITFNYIDGNACSNSITLTFTVNPQPILDIHYDDDNVLGGNDINLSSTVGGTAVCYTDGAYALQGVQEGVNAVSGSWSISTGGLSSDPNNGTISFNPTLAAQADGADLKTDPSTTHDITFDYTDGNGCQNDVTRTVEVTHVPLLSFTIEDGDIPTDQSAAEFCSSTNSILITANEDVGLDGNFTTVSSGLFSLNTGASGLIDNSNGTMAFLPSIAHLNGTDEDGNTGTTVGGKQTNHIAVFTYTNPTTGCSNSDSTEVFVNPLPNLNITSTDVDTQLNQTSFQFCANDPDFIFQGVNLNADNGGVGGFFVNGSNSKIITNTSNQATFSPAAFLEDIVGINTDFVTTFTFDDTNGCTNSYSETVTLDIVPDVSIAFNGGCESPDVDFNVVIDPLSPYAQDDMTYLWRFENSSGGDAGDTTLFSFKKRLEVPFGQISERFTATLVATSNAFGCKNEIVDPITSKDIDILITPSVSFTWDSVTVNSPVNFRINETELANDNIAGLKINFGDGTGWPIDSLNKVESLNNGVLSLEDPSDERSPFIGINNTYTSPGVYDVSVALYSNNNCIDTLIRQVNVIPEVLVTPGDLYYESFDVGDGFDPNIDGWYAESLEDDAINLAEDSIHDVAGLRNQSWVWTQLNFSDPDFSFVTNDTEEPATRQDDLDKWAWSTTGLTILDETGAVESENHYFENEASWLYSPSFDFSALERPMVRFNTIYDFNDLKEGAVLQYSINNGAKWIALGQFNNDGSTTGLKWYTSNALSSTDPGKQAQFKNEFTNQPDGWNTFSFSDPESTGGPVWVSAKHKLDEIPLSERDAVRFRFAIGATVGSKAGSIGFAFDDFEIVEREKNVLLEMFSSTVRPASETVSNLIFGTNDAIVDGQLDDPSVNNNDVFVVNYHTSIYNSTDRGADELNALNNADPSARVAYYGVDKITSFLDGNVDVTKDQADEAIIPWTSNDLGLNSLEDPLFDVTFSTDNGTDKTIDIDITYTALDTVKVGNVLVLHAAVVEKVVTGIGSDGTAESRNVLRKMLEDGAGQLVELTTDLDPNDVVSYTDNSGTTQSSLKANWTIQNVNDTDNLSLIGFVQDRDSKIVYQSNAVDITGKATVITGIDDDVTQEFTLKLYPNPADRHVTIVYPGKAVEDLNWAVFDQSGRVYKRGSTIKGFEGFEVDVNDFPSGLYYISVFGENTKYQNKKLMIVH